jgi:hypothetical protein
LRLHTVPSIDLYRELEVDPAATPETIEAAWRSLVKRHHPDVAPDRGAAVEKIKRLNLAHDWLGDRRLREMYDLTQLRRRHASVTFEEPRREPKPAAREGAQYRASALVSTAVVAVLAAAAFGSMVLGQGQARSPTIPPGNPGQSASAEVGGLGGGPTGGLGGVAGATSPLQSGAASVLGATSGVSGMSEPAFEGDVPGDCTISGRPLSLPTTIDGLDARVLFVPCGLGTTFGPLAYVRDADGWHLRSEGKLERAVAYWGFAGSITGAENEYGIAWTRDDGVTSWLALYRLEDLAPTMFWSSHDEGILWGLADYRYQLLDGAARGSLTVRAADLATGSCQRCPDHEMRLESWEWTTEQGAADESLTFRLQTEGADGLGP